MHAGRARRGAYDVQINYSPPNTSKQPGGSTLLDRVLDGIAVAFKRVEKAAGAPNGLAPLGADGLIPSAFLGDLVTPSTLMVSVTAAVNTLATATLPAVAGKFHLITSIELVKLYSASGVASGSGVIVTSTNLPGSPSWTTEQAAANQGAAVSVIKLELGAAPLRSLAAGTATTLTAPAQPQTIWRWNVTYLLGDP